MGEDSAPLPEDDLQRLSAPQRGVSVPGRPLPPSLPPSYNAFLSGWLQASFWGSCRSQSANNHPQSSSRGRFAAAEVYFQQGAGSWTRPCASGAAPELPNSWEEAGGMSLSAGECGGRCCHQPVTDSASPASEPLKLDTNRQKVPWQEEVEQLKGGRKRVPGARSRFLSLSSSKPSERERSGALWMFPVPAGRRSHSLIWDGWLLLCFFFRGIVRGSPRNGTGSSGAEFFSGQSEPCCSFCQAAARVLHLDLVWRCLKLEFKWIQTRAPVLKCFEEGLQWSEKAACPTARCPTCPDGPCGLLGVISAVPNGISPQ